MIEIELTAPARVNGRAAAHQSLWLLLRLWIIATGADPLRSTWLRAAQLREQFHAARSNPRMQVSRAFADFERWSIRVGWGTSRSRPPALLPRTGRSRGPFWLADGEAGRIRITLNGVAVDSDDVLEWLACTDAAVGDAGELAGDSSAAYWHSWSEARDQMLQGRLIVSPGQGALGGYRQAQALAGENAHAAALALLQQAIVWRRAGNPDAARAVLDELDRHWHDLQAPRHAWLGAMAAIVSAWCAYADRDARAARGILQTAAADPRWAMLFQHYPRVRCESVNLWALLHRAAALDDTRPNNERSSAASAALQHYREALELACEADLYDFASSAASNLGWSLWLFERCQLPVPDGGEPLRWIALAESLGRHQGRGSGVWNLIYLLRIIRNGGPDVVHPEGPAFARWPVLAPKDAAARAAPVPLPQGYTNWRELADAQLDLVQRGQVQVDALQRANLLLEAAWYAAHDGDIVAAESLATRLRRRLRELLPVDRGFFRDALRRLPIGGQ